MTPEGWITLVVLGAILAVLVWDWVSPPTALIGGVVVLVLSGVLEPEEAFAGFSNEATITIAALYVVAYAVGQTGGISYSLRRILGNPSGERRVLGRLVAPVAVLSGFLNNTPIVATLAPMVRGWAQSVGRSPSTYLMPLSFAAILGGMVTTIGTSTNLVVSGLLTDGGLEPLGLFEITALGLPIAIVGVALLVALSPRLLPARESPAQQIVGHGREYAFRMVVTSFGPADGRTVSAVGLRNLVGVYLAAIERSTTEIAPIGPDQVLLGGDVLTFVGRVDDVRDVQATPGLESSEGEHLGGLVGSSHRLYEAVVGPTSSLVGKSLKEVGFRSRFGAAVMAIHRAGEPVTTKLGATRLQVGDVLLVLGQPEFAPRWRPTHEFLVIDPLIDVEPEASRRSILVGLILVAMVVTAGTGLLTLIEASLGAVLVLLATRTITAGKARDAVDLDVILVVAGALGLGAAVRLSGLATLVADGVAEVSDAVGSTGGLAVILLATILLTEVITNTAAAAVMVPIAVNLAVDLGVDPRGFAIAVAIGASASFLTPIGYQTNTMVYGLGGYRFADYWRLGFPLTAVTVAATLVMVPWLWP